MHWFECRTWLTHHIDRGPVTQAARVSDEALHDAVIANGMVACVNSKYVLAHTAEGVANDLRQLLLKLLTQKPTLRRQDVMAAARAASLQIPDSLYNRTMKELCQAHNNAWSLKIWGCSIVGSQTTSTAPDEHVSLSHWQTSTHAPI